MASAEAPNKVPHSNTDSSADPAKIGVWVWAFRRAHGVGLLPGVISSKVVSGG